MDWSRTKTIFIVAFLLVNIFLTYQLKEKNNEISLMVEATIQEILTEMNVTIEADVVEEFPIGVYIVGKQKPFSEEELVGELQNQEISIINETFLNSKLTEPYPVQVEEIALDVDNFLRTHVHRGDEYRFGSYDEERNEIIVHQMYEDKKTFSYEEIQLVLTLNNENDITSYQQYYLELEEQGREQEIVAALKAIEILLNERIIVANQTISTIEFGYYSLFKPLGDVQVFAPMWKITVEDESYLVNAIDGSIQQFN
ncbi:two-component system regulatory protein YycI [Bacillus sp. FJAT-45350]|uniref:two-component system regulatory protein YycI n=1 Tax=Bacillus sp. FJAT-45350 TaxID=2011014 RepID=UPI000BB818CB|nr:two-component system regulatory protein YycI [Bacillus sp. FJAT-45350]